MQGRLLRSGEERMASEWHPILAAVEVEPGHWNMVGQWDRIYGVIRLLEIGGERGYRAVTWAERSEDRELIGYYRSLRAACEAVQLALVAASSGASPNYDGWGYNRF